MKSFARGLASTLLKLSLFGVALTASILAVFASPAPIKDALADTQLYDGVVKSILDTVSKNGEGDSAAPADKQRSLDVLETAATQAFTPALLQSSTEQVLDSVFRWLNGESETPDFRIDLSGAKANFIAAAGAEVEKYVSSLPVCTRSQMQSIDPEADPFSLTCRPSNLSAADIKNQAVAELVGNKDFFPNPVLSAENLPKNENGRTVFEEVEPARNIYKIIKFLPWVLLGLIALLGAGVFFLSDTQRKGFKSLGVTFLGTGLFLLIGTWLGTFLFDRATGPNSSLLKNIDNDFQEAGLAIARSLNNVFGRTVLMYCIAYISIGVVTLLALRLTRPKLAPVPAAEPTPEASKTEPKPPEKEEKS